MKDLTLEVIKQRGLISSSNPPLSIQDLSPTPNICVGGQSLQCYDLPHLIALEERKEHGQPPKNSYDRTHSQWDPSGLGPLEWGKGTSELMLVTILTL